MHDLAAGDPAPDLTLATPDGPLRLADAGASRPVLLLFYQEAGTPTCEAQLRSFAAEGEVLDESGARVVALGVDPPDACARFAARLAAPFPLLPDPDGAAARAFGVYDTESRRARRAAFVIRDGRVVFALPWYNPANSGQFEQIFAALME